MFSKILFITLFLTIISARNIPEPEARCNFKRRSERECRAHVLKLCGPGVTASRASCRSISFRWCRRPRPVRDVESCVRANCGHLKPQGKWHPREEMIEKCALGMRPLCTESVESCRQPEAQPLPVIREVAPEEIKKWDNPEPEPQCRLPRRSNAECKAHVLKLCGPGFTASRAACRSISFKWCANPRPINDVDACVRANCGHLKQRGRNHPAHEMRQKCALGMRPLCQEAARGCTRPQAEPLPIIVKVPEREIQRWEPPRPQVINKHEHHHHHHKTVIQRVDDREIMRKVRKETRRLERLANRKLREEKRRLRRQFEHERRQLQQERDAFQTQTQVILQQVRIEAARKPPIVVVPPTPCAQKCPDPDQNLVKKVHSVNEVMDKLLAGLKAVKK